MELVTLSHTERYDCAKELAELFGDTVKKEDLLVVVGFLEKIPLSPRLVKIWRMVDELKKVTPSNRAEVLKDAKVILSKKQKGF